MFYYYNLYSYVISLTSVTCKILLECWSEELMEEKGVMEGWSEGIMDE